MIQPDAPQRCARCPRAAAEACAGEDVPRLCQLVDPDHPDHDPSYLAALAPALAPPALRPVGESLRLLREARACPRRRERPDCGCDGAASCAEGRGRNGLVALSDCFACLSYAPTPDHPPRTGRTAP